MTALEYMEKKVNNHKLSYIRECARKAPEGQLENIRKKISYYEAAIEALRFGEVIHCKDCSKEWCYLR